MGDAAVAGTIILAANNTYSAGTNIAGGILSVDTDSNLGTGSITTRALYPAMG